MAAGGCVLKCLLRFGLVATLLLVLLSCGGGGGGTQQNPIVFTETVTLGPAGGSIVDATRGIELTVPTDAFSQPTEVTLEVRQSQRTGVTPNGWATNENAVDVSVDPAAITETGEIEVHIPFEALDPEQRALVLSTNDQGVVVPIEAEYESDGFTGLVTKEVLEDAGRSRSRGAERTVGLFLQITSVLLSQPSGGLWVYESGTFRQPQPGETMDQECTAVLVHGINDNRQDLLPLAQFLLRSDIAPGDNPAYDEVWVYQYNWLAGIDGSGADFANDVKAVAGTGKIDVWGHSMGGLVARWAIEKEELGDEVGRLYTLGTPHEGFPFERVASFLAYLLNVPLTDGLEDLLSNSEFMDSVNAGQSPYAATAKYFTLCGDEWYGLFSPIGLLYSWYDIDNDSVVPVFSAQSFVLSNKSNYWNANTSATATIGLNHSDLRSSGQSVSPLAQTVFTDDSRGWLEACEHGGGGDWLVINLHPTGATASSVRGVGDGQQVGEAKVGGQWRASLWTGSAASWEDLTPSGSPLSQAYGVKDGRQVGFADVGEINNRHAWVWSSSASSWVDLNVTEWSNSIAYSTHGSQQVGISTASGGWEACLWYGTAASWVNLAPVDSAYSVASDVYAGQQVGVTVVGGQWRASLWTGTAASWVDLTPAGASFSAAYGVHNGQQVGRATVDGFSHACLWYGTVGSWVDLNPIGSVTSRAFDTFNGHQVGQALVGGEEHASLWRGTASSWVDLHGFLPAGFTESCANGIWQDGVFTYVVGYGYNSATERNEALMWVKSN